MIRLLYLSTLSADVTANDIAIIVDEAASWNADFDVTGILAIEGRRVCQILEGDEAVVLRLFESIKRDRRHHGVLEMDRRPIVRRAYPEWSMVRRPMVEMVLAAFPE